jgi:hypothetical protein
MYEFVKTATGWRVFWGIDPRAGEPQAKREAAADPGAREPDVLPFRGREPKAAVRPAG